MRLVLLIALLLSLGQPCVAEEAREELASFDLTPLEEFAAEHAPEADIRGAAGEILAGGADVERIAGMFLEKLQTPAREIGNCAAKLAAPIALMALGSCVFRGDGARFLLRLTLLEGLMDAALLSIEAARSCLNTACGFADAASPVLAALMTATGMHNSASLLSPAAAVAGNIIEKVFVAVGLPLCRAALCTACASGFGDGLRLKRLGGLLKRCSTWMVGLSFTLFTALVALQGSVTMNLDGLSLRTAKFAVDSAAPVIGSGVSDAWESYVAGMAAARGAVGISGMIALMLAGAQPVLRSLGVMLLLEVCAALLDLFGEESSARACEQVAAVSRMGLELSTGALAIAMILLGALVFAGRSIAA